MHRIAVSVLCIITCSAAFADARLPVVNIGAGGVSARAAFGDATTSAPATTVAKTIVKPVAVAPATKKKTVTARATATAAHVASKSVDTGEKIAAADTLVPRRPSNDLWAHNGATDAPLRMPNANEFSVVRADYALPEESLDNAPRLARDNVQTTSRTTTTAAQKPMAELDAQIARLVELQRRADESVADARPTRTARVTEPAAPARMIETPAPAAATTATPTAPITIARAPVAPAAEEVTPAQPTISRMVVPMDDDVIVRAVEKSASPKIAAVRNDMTSMSPTELRKAFRKTYLSENKHLSTFQMDNRFDVASEMTTEGFTARRDLSEADDIRVLEIKIKFRNQDSALSRENYELLSTYAGVVVNNPKRAIQISIPQSVTTDSDERKLAARRLAIVEQVLRDTGVSEQRIMPVLAARQEDAFVLRIISSDQYETLTRQQRDMFGDTVNKKSYKSMSW